MALCAAPAFAAGASANLTGPGEVETDGNMTVVLHIDGTGITAFSGTIEYDPDQLSVQHTEQRLFGTWQIGVQARDGYVTFTAQDPQGASAIDTDTEILAVSFYVHNASPGEAVDVRAVDITGTDIDGAFDAPDAVYHQVVASNQSSDATLSSITVQGGTWSPAFSPQVTSYEVTLPSGTERVDVQAVPTDENAQVTGTGNIGLSQGQSRTVTLTCTAEDGTQKTYTLVLTRQRDENAGAAVTASPGATIAPSAAPEGEGMQGGTILLIVLLGVLALGVGGWIAYTVMRKKAEEARRERRMRQSAARREAHAPAKEPPRQRGAYADDDRYDRPQAHRDDAPRYAERAERQAEAAPAYRQPPQARPADRAVAEPPDTDWYDDALSAGGAYGMDDGYAPSPEPAAQEPKAVEPADGTRVYAPHRSVHTTERPRRVTREDHARATRRPASRRPDGTRRPNRPNEDE